VAGINRATTTNFQCYQNDNTGTPRALTMALMDDVHSNFVDSYGGRYDRILTSQTQVDAYTALSSGNGFPAPTRMVLSNADNSAIALGGFGMIDPLEPAAYYRGRPIFALPGYASDLMHFVDMSQLELEILRDVRVDLKASTNDDITWYVTWKGQLTLRNPRMGAAVLDDLS
jgi:hypothetical protein